LSLLTASCYGATNQVNFLNWADYIAPNTIPDFQQKTGITVNQNYFDSEEMLRTELMAGGSGYDLAIMDVVDIPQESQAGILQPIDKSKLPNYKYINPDLYKLAAATDPGNKYGIIYSYGTTGIAYNKKMIDKVLGPNVKIDSWKILFDPYYLSKLQTCGVAFLDDSNQIFGLTKYYLGLNPNSTNPEDYRKATAYMMTIRPYITYFDNNRYIPDLASGNICIAMGYSGDVLRAKQQAEQAGADVDIHYVLPKEGTSIWFDMVVMPANAPDPEAAMQFLNYLMSPKVMADISNALFQPNAEPASTPYMNPILQDPAYTPSAELVSKLFNIRTQPPQLDDLVSKLWFQIKYGVDMD
jgi:putrescine transport system substrate-binding protein